MLYFTKWRWTVGHWIRLREEWEDMFLHHDHQQDLLWCDKRGIFLSLTLFDHSFLHIKPLTMAQWAVSGTVLGAGVLAAIVNAIMKCGSLKGVDETSWHVSLRHFDGIFGSCLPPCLKMWETMPYLASGKGNYIITWHIPLEKHCKKNGVTYQALSSPDFSLGLHLTIAPQLGSWYVRNQPASHLWC